MPETAEEWAHLLTLITHYETLQNLDNSHPLPDGTSHLQLQGIWADLTEKEQDPNNDSHTKVVKLDASSTIVRGQTKRQTPVWPSMWKEAGSSEVTSLKWSGVSRVSRAARLNFNLLHFQLAYLTHTSVQLYRREVWEDTVRVMTKKQRGFRIGVAFEFTTHVLAFVTQDMLFQPYWAKDPSELPQGAACIYTSFSQFITNLTKWLCDECGGRDDDGALFIDVVRQAPDIWDGVGAYTIIELIFKAGLSPCLSKKEVFGNLSRTARLIAALWTYVHIFRQYMSLFLRPAMHDGMLCPTKEQRHKYEDHLRVWGKNKTRVSGRQYMLWEVYKLEITCLSKLEFWYRDQTRLYDVFEPELIMDFLKEYPAFGPLIFGDTVWSRLPDAAKLGNKGETLAKQLSACFSHKGRTVTHLHPEVYRALKWHRFAPNQPTYHTVRTYLYKASEFSKRVWSIVPAFPDEGLWGYQRGLLKKSERKRIPAFEPILGRARKALLFKNIVDSAGGIAIGPLEYCGHGFAFKDTHGRYLFAAAHTDPRLPVSVIKQEAVKKDRVKAHVDEPGKAKRAMTSGVVRQRKKVLEAVENIISLKRGRSDDTSDVNEPPSKRVKKSRRSVDKQMVTLVGDTLSTGRRQTRSSSSSSTLC